MHRGEKGILPRLARASALPFSAFPHVSTLLVETVAWCRSAAWRRGVLDAQLFCGAMDHFSGHPCGHLAPVGPSSLHLGQHPLGCSDSDRNHTIWNARLVLATTSLHLAQFRHKHRLLAKVVDYAEIFIHDKAQQEAVLSDIAILGALPHKCLLLRLGDPIEVAPSLDGSSNKSALCLTGSPLASDLRGNHCLFVAY